MKKLILLLTLSIGTLVFALDPALPVMHIPTTNLFSVLPSYYNGSIVTAEWRQAVSEWDALNHTEPVLVTVLVTNVIDRTAYTNIVEGGVTSSVPVDPTYHLATNLQQRAIAALYQINPNKDPVATLIAMRTMMPEEFNAKAQARLDEAVGDDKFDVLAGASELQAIFAELTVLQLNWRSAEFTATNKVEVYEYHKLTVE